MEDGHAMIAVCPNKSCNQRYRIKPGMIGRNARCKKCNNPFTIEELIYPPKPLELVFLKNDSIEKEANPKDGHTLSPEKIHSSSTRGLPQAFSNRSIKKKARAAPWLIAMALFGVFASLFIGNFHVVKGGNQRLSLVGRDSFGFSEVFIDADKIKSMPPVAAAAAFPLGYKVLQREGIIKSDSAVEKRMEYKEKRELDQAVQEAQRAIYKMMQENQKHSK
jgi:hypothetical protein